MKPRTRFNARWTKTQRNKLWTKSEMNKKKETNKIIQIIQILARRMQRQWNSIIKNWQCYTNIIRWFWWWNLMSYRLSWTDQNNVFINSRFSLFFFPRICVDLCASLPVEFRYSLINIMSERSWSYLQAPKPACDIHKKAKADIRFFFYWNFK